MDLNIIPCSFCKTPVDITAKNVIEVDDHKETIQAICADCWEKIDGYIRDAAASDD